MPWIGLSTPRRPSATDAARACSRWPSSLSARAARQLRRAYSSCSQSVVCSIVLRLYHHLPRRQSSVLQPPMCQSPLLSPSAYSSPPWGRGWVRGDFPAPALAFTTTPVQNPVDNFPFSVDKHGHLWITPPSLSPSPHLPRHSTDAFPLSTISPHPACGELSVAKPPYIRSAPGFSPPSGPLEGSQELYPQFQHPYYYNYI